MARHYHILVVVIWNHAESWFDSSNSLIFIYQIRICISRDNILRTYTKIYRNNSGSLSVRPRNPTDIISP